MDLDRHLIKILIILLFAGLSNIANGRVVDQIVATVGDDPITLSELKAFQKSLQSSPKQLRDEEKAILNNLHEMLNIKTEDKIFEKEIERLGLGAKKQEVDSEIEKIRSRLNVSMQELKESLKTQGASYADYSGFIKRQIEQRRLISQEIRSNVSISDEDVINFYQQNISKSPANAEYRTRQILLVVNSEKEEAVLNRAQQLAKRARSGESFELLARQYSTDQSASSGGDLGWLKMDEMIPEFQYFIPKLRPGEVSEPFKTKAGVHIIFLQDVRNMAPPDLTPQLKERITNMLFQERIGILLKQWFERLKQERYTVKKMM